MLPIASNLPPEQVEELSPLVLAYVGDAVYELLVRSYLVQGGKTRVDALHREAVEFVAAVNQARLVPRVEERLTPEEKEVLRRGRNARPGHLPRHATPLEYRYSTALETLFGYLYLKGNWSRLQQVFAAVCELVEGDDRS
ncbi:ribonuclease III domain-containing protein [Moorellaceae bacterium AZ2]